MRFKELELSGAFEIELEKIEDERGFFARSWCSDEFKRLGLCSNFVQSNISYNKYKNTIRGLHYQSPFPETKLIRCIRGAIYDVIVDIRPDSETFGKWIGRILSDKNQIMLYVPVGFAHGFLTMTDDCEIFYMMGEFYYPDKGKGIRWNDPYFSIEWPLDNDPILSPKDQSYEDFMVSEGDKL